MPAAAVLNRETPLAFGFSRYDIRRGFRIKQAQLPVLKRPARKLPGKSKPAAVVLADRLQQRFDNRPPAMHMEFPAVLTRKAIGGRKEESEAAIQL